MSTATSSTTGPSSTTTTTTRRTTTRRRTTLALLAITALGLAPTARASQGDRSPEFQHCLSSCTADNCGSETIDDGVVLTKRLPLILRATLWSCTDNCKYHCTHIVTNEAYARVQRIKEDAWKQARYLPLSGDDTAGVGEGGALRLHERSPADRRAEASRIVAAELARLRPVQKEMVQYYGKWVFIRFLGAQEPLSVVFSFLNLREHVNAFYKLRRDVPDAYPLKLVYILHALISVNAWTWSAVFHWRDKPLTERLDYFSAASTLLSGLFFSLCRLYRLEPDSRQFSTLLRAFAGVFVLHCLYLSIGRFDYGYNVLACLFIALVHELLWFVFSFRPTLFASNQLLERYHSNRAAFRAAKPQTSSIASVSAATGSTSPLPAPVASPAAHYKGHSPASASASSSSGVGGGGSSSVAHLLANGPPSSSPAARRELQKILFLLLGAMSFEILDFPPLLRALDAHALWHLATVRLVRMWYAWLIRDARECVFTGWWVGDALAPLASRSSSGGGAGAGVYANGGVANGSFDRGGGSSTTGASESLGLKIGSRMLRPSDGFSADGYAGALRLRAAVGDLVSSTREWATDALTGQNGHRYRYRYPPLEFHALTAKLNALAGRAGLSAGGSAASAASGSPIATTPTTLAGDGDGLSSTTSIMAAGLSLGAGAGGNPGAGPGAGLGGPPGAVGLKMDGGSQDG